MSAVANTELAELDSRLADVVAGISAGQAKLRAALLAGGDTGSVRKFLAAQQTQQAEIGRARAELLASIEAQEARGVAAAGERLAAEVGARVASRLAALAPPPQPGGH